MGNYEINAGVVNPAVKIKISLDRVRQRIRNGKNTLDNIIKEEELSKDLRRLQDQMTCHDFTEFTKRTA